MNSKSIYNKNNNFAKKEIVGELVLVPLTDNVANMDKVYTLNETAYFIYNNINGLNTIDDICSNLTKKYDIDFHTAKIDVNNIINDMLEKNVIY